ncbi:DUF2589 domain-containing protein [Enterovibrio sp. ZSDZ42]|uniref:DUF2589 domain-containing protein n=1 Tax=Enterovibrio gelatinilyticus TaxID=2899819 RepID=A0ABT5R2Z5_9GAMM|nr:DUF2589 domain-containing protein [Enterovibrio sp. ZSDZ42]MDD1794535.1 DUF2589 domain-containing protein [Enterovibrio sp. ZSDZ42]
MINLNSLVSAVHLSVTKANQALQNENQELMNRFFDAVPSEDSGRVGDIEGSESNNKNVYRPKYVTIEYPTETSDGIQTISVDVPLLTLVPLASPRVSEVKFKTNLEVNVNEDNGLDVSFSGNNKGGLFKSGENKSPTAELEITINADEPPEGLKKLIEGYERALRAQIPG